MDPGLVPWWQHRDRIPVTTLPGREEGHMTDRISQLRNLLESEPDDTFCLYGIAMEYAKAGQPDRAIAHFDRTIEVDPAYCYAYFHKARCLMEANRMEEARETLVEGLEQARSSGDIHAEGEIESLLASVSP